MKPGLIPGMPPGRVVILGASHGGVQLAASLRLDGFAGSVTLIEREGGLPYQRPPLSKAFMKGADAGSLLLRPPGFYEANAIDLLAGLTVTGIARGDRLVRTSDGAEHPYDHLVVASGSRTILPAIPGIGCSGVHSLRTRDEAATLRAALAGLRTVAVVGGGFIGLEFAAVARGLGLKVVIIEAADRLMSRVVSPAISSMFLDIHRGSGSTVLLGVPAARVIDDGAGRAAGVVLADGRTVPSDAVLVAVGVRPETELAAAAGLRIDNGIAVDGMLVTSDPTISAIGDCASFPFHPAGRRVRLESVQAASDQARAVSKRLTGKPAVYDATPWFWSDQGTAKLQIVGLTTGTDDTVTTEPGPGGTAVFCFAEDVLLGIETVNAPGEHMAGRKLMSEGPLVSRDELDRASYDIRSVLAGRPIERASP